jgi:hypothetical protein
MSIMLVSSRGFNHRSMAPRENRPLGLVTLLPDNWSAWFKLIKVLPNCPVSNRRELGIPNIFTNDPTFKQHAVWKTPALGKLKTDGLVQGESNHAPLSCTEERESVRQVMETCVRLDHLATWNEVCDALGYLSRDAFELAHACQSDCELEDRESNGVDILVEELAWLRVANEVLDCRLN